ncbi:MAG TPA: ribosome silencing factor [Gammaproteobacteria bacterium]|nr:ribosome silencing factor [Gammaproteobacteria bacterium]
MTADELKDLAVAALDDLKAVDVKVLDVKDVTAITDVMVVASGNSDRHVRSLAHAVLDAAKEAGIKPLGIEGERGGEWILLDLNDIIVHVMLPRMREFYNLEKLWSVDAHAPLRSVGGGEQPGL